MKNTQVEELSVTKTKAKAEVDALKQAVKQNETLLKESMYKDLQKVYGHMQHGGKVIDLYESFKKAGLNVDGDPKLAIARADGQIVYLKKYGDGGASFKIDRNKRTPNNWEFLKKWGDLCIPAKTFTWTREDVKPYPAATYTTKQIKHESAQAIIPIIPAKILTIIKSKLSNYYLLWEVEKWEPIPPKDPILLKQLTPNLFGVLATWDLTLIERAIIRGRIQ